MSVLSGAASGRFLLWMILLLICLTRCTVTQFSHVSSVSLSTAVTDTATETHSENGDRISWPPLGKDFTEPLATGDKYTSNYKEGFTMVVTPNAGQELASRLTVTEEKASVSVGNGVTYVTLMEEEEEDEDHPYSVAGDYIYKYGMTLLFIFGSVGNTLALVVLFRTSFRQNSSSLYLMAVGFIDQCNIFTAVLGSHVIRSYWDFDYIRYHRWLCKWAYFIIVTCAQSSFYLVAAMSVERSLVVLRPLRFMNTFTRKQTKFLIFVIVLIWVLKNLHIFWSNGAVYKYSPNGTKEELISECGYNLRPKGLHDFNIRVRPWLDNAITFTAAAIILCSNVIIILTVQRSIKKQKQMTSELETKAHTKAHRMVPMLVTISLTFLVLALPLQVVTLIWPNNPNDRSSASAALARMCWSIGLLTNYMNNGINFYIYCLSGSAFRKEFCAMFHTRKKHQSQTSKISLNTSGGTQI